MRVPTGFTGRVAAGAIAERYLKMAYGVEIVAFVSSVGKVELPSYVAPPSQVPENDEQDAGELVQEQDAPSEPPSDAEKTAREQEVWESFREEHYEGM